jgi:hypothetical protein
MKSFKTYLIEENKKPNYSGVVLSDESRDALFVQPAISSMITSGMERIGHHMTIKMGGLEGTDHVVGSPATLTATHIGYLGDRNNPSVVAVKVAGYRSQNEHPHITVGVNRELGGKPFHSNKITNWEELQAPFIMQGNVQEVFK